MKLKIGDYVQRKTRPNGTVWRVTGLEPAGAYRFPNVQLASTTTGLRSRIRPTALQRVETMEEVAA